MHKPWCLAAALVAFALAMIAARASNATPLEDYRALLAEVERVYASALANPRAVITPSAIDWPVQPDMPSGAVSEMDIRIVLAQLARSAGANGQLSVLRAQPSVSAQALVIKNGALSLEAVRAAYPDAVGPHGFTQPIVIWPGARLEMRAGDVLRLSRPDGAFLANFGALLIEGGTIESAGAANTGAPEFAPFIVTSGAGFALIRGAHLRGLGFGLSPAFSGLAFVKGGLYPSDAPSLIVDSLIEDIGGVTFRGSEEARLVGNIIAAPRRHGVELRATSRVTLQDNLILDAGRNAIRLTNRANASLIMSNRLFNARSTAIHIETLSHEARVVDNLIWGTRGNALTMHRADCADVAGNTFLHNRGKGVSLRAVQGATVTGNAFYTNTSAAIFLADQPGGVPTRIAGNIFAGNLAGLSAASGAKLLLIGNDFTEQFPRFFDGDLTIASPAILKDLTGTTALTLDAGDRPGSALPPVTCEREG
ncbi:MAG: NosD domain-containing protein [Pseudomonadota bacterium]